MRCNSCSHPSPRYGRRIRLESVDNVKTIVDLLKA
jgi:hypothetical protein